MKRFGAIERALGRVLNEIVRPRAIARQPARVAAQLGQMREKVALEAQGRAPARVTQASEAFAINSCLRRPARSAPPTNSAHFAYRSRNPPRPAQG